MTAQSGAVERRKAVEQGACMNVGASLEQQQSHVDRSGRVRSRRYVKGGLAIFVRRVDVNEAHLEKVLLGVEPA